MSDDINFLGTSHGKRFRFSIEMRIKHKAGITRRDITADSTLASNYVCKNACVCAGEWHKLSALLFLHSFNAT